MPRVPRAVRGEWVLIEEVAAGQFDRAQHVVVQHALLHVAVVSVRMQPVHAVRPEAHPAARARLAVPVVAQIEVACKRLAAMRRTDAARQVVLAVDGIGPDLVHRVAIRLVAQQQSHVGHGRVEIGRSHRMALGFGHLDGRPVRLVIGVRLDLVLMVQEVLGQPEVSLACIAAFHLTDQLGQAAQRVLQPGVSVLPGPLG